jgi:DNA polymerase
MMLRDTTYVKGSGTVTIVPEFDFETRSAAGYRWVEAEQKWRAPEGVSSTKRGLSVVGRRNYILHPTFRVLWLAWDLKDGTGRHRWTPPRDLRKLALCEVAPASRGGSSPYGDERHPWGLLDWIASSGHMEAWNSGFEFDVWNLYCVPTWGWPPLHLEQTSCAMAKAAAYAYPRGLGDAGEVMDLTLKKDKDGDRLLKKFSIPRNPTKKDSRIWIEPEDDPVDFTRLGDYNETDVGSEAEASSKIPDLSPAEREIWLTDQRINLRGIQVDMVGVENCITIVEQAHAKYNAELYELTNHHVAAASELDKIKAWAKTQGVYLSSLTDEAVTDALTWPGLPDSVKRALEIRQLLGSASIKKLFAFRHQQCNGRLYDLYSYFAARTGRWTGNGPQPQNLPKGFLDTIEAVNAALDAIATRTLEYVEYLYPGRTALEVVGACLRGLLIAAPGHELICSDFSAIEGVVTAALAGESWRLDVFRTHGMIYEASAASICGIPFEEFVRHKREVGKHHPMRNKIGKFAELACGFGGWIGAMKRFGADEFLDDTQMKEAILKWRAASPMIVELWGGQSRGEWENKRQEYYGLEGAAIQAVLNPGRAFEYRGIVYQMSVAEDILFCRTPSGGFLTYHSPRLEPSQRDWAPRWELSLSYEGWNNNPQMGPLGWVRMSWYGGKGYGKRRAKRGAGNTGKRASKTGSSRLPPRDSLAR